jgi:hypothetical protein
MSPDEPGTLFDESVTPWQAWSPREAGDQLSAIQVAGRPVRWAVTGGWAIDLHLGRITRAHDDLEIAVLEADAAAVLAAFTEPAWRWDIPLDGRLHAWDSVAATQTHQAWLWSQEHQGFVLDLMRERHDGPSWLFRRDEAIRRDWCEVVCADQDGIPYLTPEVVLLFKAKYHRGKDVLDLEAVLPTLESGRRGWLRAAVEQVHPGHPWLARL